MTEVTNPGSSRKEKPRTSGNIVCGEVNGTLSVEDHTLLSSWRRACPSRPRNSRHYSTSACSTSSSSCPASASSTTGCESQSSSGSTIITLTSNGVPIVAIGHLSEETDFGALAFELDKYAEFASLSSRTSWSPSSGAVHVQGSAPGPHCQREEAMYRTGKKATLNEYLQKMDDMTTSLIRTVSTPSASSKAPSSDHSRSSWPESCSEGSHHGHYGSGLPNNLAILVDTDSGRRRRARKTRPTLAQTLSLLQSQASAPGSSEAIRTIRDTASPDRQSMEQGDQTVISSKTASGGTSSGPARLLRTLGSNSAGHPNGKVTDCPAPSVFKPCTQSTAIVIDALTPLPEGTQVPHRNSPVKVRFANDI